MVIEWSRKWTMQSNWKLKGASRWNNQIWWGCSPQRAVKGSGRPCNIRIITHTPIIATITPGSPIPIPVPKAILSLLSNPLPPDPVEVEPAVVPVGEDGDAWPPEVVVVGSVGETSSCAQNPFTIEVADAMFVWRVLHPLAATEEAADTAAGNWLHAHVQSEQSISQGMQPP